MLILAQIDGFLICVRLTLAFVDGWCSERVTFGAGQAFFAQIVGFLIRVRLTHLPLWMAGALKE
jgi:hypothetical protein